MKATLQNGPATANAELSRHEFVSPEINISEGSDGYELEAEMPGVNKDGLEITLAGTQLTLVGRRHAAPISGDALIRECQRADYHRVFELDPAIDTGRITARVEQGVLKLNLPKSESVKPRRISVGD